MIQVLLVSLQLLFNKHLNHSLISQLLLMLQHKIKALILQFKIKILIPKVQEVLTQLLIRHSLLLNRVYHLLMTQQQLHKILNQLQDLLTNQLVLKLRPKVHKLRHYLQINHRHSKILPPLLHHKLVLAQLTLHQLQVQLLKEEEDSCK